MSGAFSYVEKIICLFEENRRNSEIEFSNYFKNAYQATTLVGEEIKIPRACGWQTKRANPNTSSPEEWFRITNFIPLIDHFIIELKTRFNDRFKEIRPLGSLIPANRDVYNIDDILKASLIYMKDLPANSDMELQAELELWKLKWTKSAIETLQYCDTFYSSIKVLLKIFATITITTATAERLFSALSRLKNYMRSTMSEDRLNGLAVLHIHKHLPIEIHNVITRFSRQKPRRMKIEDWSK